MLNVESFAQKTAATAPEIHRRVNHHGGSACVPPAERTDESRGHLQLVVFEPLQRGLQQLDVPRGDGSGDRTTRVEELQEAPARQMATERGLRSIEKIR